MGVTSDRKSRVTHRKSRENHAEMLEITPTPQHATRSGFKQLLMSNSPKVENYRSSRSSSWRGPYLYGYDMYVLVSTTRLSNTRPYCFFRGMARILLVAGLRRVVNISQPLVGQRAFQFIQNVLPHDIKVERTVPADIEGKATHFAADLTRGRLVPVVFGTPRHKLRDGISF